MLEFGIQMVRGIIQEGSLCYVPFGMLVCERVLDGKPVVGLRTATLDNINLESFCKLAVDYKNHPDGQAALKSFWKTAGEGIETDTATTRGEFVELASVTGTVPPAPASPPWPAAPAAAEEATCATIAKGAAAAAPPAPDAAAAAPAGPLLLHPSRT